MRPWKHFKTSNGQPCKILKVLCISSPMALEFCPVCRAPVLRVADRPFCSKCGWNGKAVEQELQRKKHDQWVLNFISLAAVALIWAVYRGWVAVSVWAALYLLLDARSYSLLRKNLRTWENAKEGRDDSHSIPAIPDVSSIGNPRFTAQDSLLHSLLRPRPVHLSRAGRKWITLLMFVFAALGSLLTWFIWDERMEHGNKVVADPLFYLWTAFLLALLLCPICLWITVKRSRLLLQTGDLGTGTIIRRYRGDYFHSIKYEFVDAAGKLWKRTVPDWSGRYDEGMTLPIFFLENRPERQVAICESFYEIEFPTTE